MEPRRQRRSAMGVRCQVCDRQLEAIADQPDPRAGVHWLADLMQVRELDDRRPGALVLEPWVCGECLAYALQVCPGLNGSRRRRPHVLAVLSANAVATMTRPGGNLAGSRLVPPEGVVGYVKIEPLEYKRIKAGLFLEYGPAEIEQLLVEEVFA
jgi:hypothetical protein